MKGRTAALLLLTALVLAVVLAQGNCADLGHAPMVESPAGESSPKGVQKAVSYKRVVDRHYLRNHVPPPQNPLPHIPGYIPVYIQRDGSY